ncbi:hypothetical protein KBC04_04485 [Candidatus Babeliales bacterium]|nr:hypothetical protein [Candidatus Babeliales bacterium]MBP9844078.1 hypothetical protein [Candidatus Babeliales bacterium]
MQYFKKILVFYITLLSAGLLQADQPITLFCHGIVDNERQSERFHEVLEQPVQIFNFQDAQKPEKFDLNSLIFQTCFLFGKFVNRDKMFMGQSQDVLTLAQQIDLGKEYILYGVSRGGSAAINYIADYNPLNIKALILDAAPADMISPVDALQYAVGYKFASSRVQQENIFQAVFPSYEIGSVPPIKNISKIKNKKLPIFIVHSMEDSRVSTSSAWQLYLAFKDNGFENVYLCELLQGKHSFCMQGPDKDLYIHGLHSFYKKYNFAYNEKYADINLDIFQPTKEEILEKLKLYQKKLEDLYNIRKLELQGSIAILFSGIILRSWLYSKNNEFNS